MSLNRFRMPSLSDKHEEEEAVVLDERQVQEEKIKSSKKTKPVKNPKK